ncbi:MAG: glycosyltransferase family 4 protein [Opitutae bacterium]|nr:glycosyltransferase family 4 protein [Opitutae bacterium]
MSRKKQLFLIRRQSGGTGGAEAVVEDFTYRLGNNWGVERVSAGEEVDGIRIGGTTGPGWGRSLQFAKHVDRLIDRVGPDAVLSFERGPLCDLYRAGDGVHRHWMKLKYGGSCRWMFNPLNWVFPSQERQTVASARVVVANSEMVAAGLRQVYPDMVGKVRVIRNGFDPNRFHLGSSDALTSLDLPADAKPFLFLGSGWQRKGLCYAMAFLASVTKRDKAYREKGFLLVAGEGDTASYRAHADRLGIKDKVVFLGSVSDPAPLCRVAELMVLPTQYDPFSNAVLEALACGCPVLTSTANGASEVIDHGRTGLVFDNSQEEDPSDWAKEFLETRFDPRESIAKSVAVMTREAELNRYEELLNEIVHSGEAAGG